MECLRVIHDKRRILDKDTVALTKVFWSMHESCVVDALDASTAEPKVKCLAKPVRLLVVFYSTNQSLGSGREQEMETIKGELRRLLRSLSA